MTEIVPNFDESKRKRAERIREESLNRGNERAPIAFDVLKSSFDIPEEVANAIAQKEYVAAWIVFSCYGEQQQSRVDDAIDKGWWPVLRSDYPGLANRFLTFSKEEKEYDYIIKKGQILMERPLALHKQELKVYEDAALEQEDLINRHRNRTPQNSTNRVYTPPSYRWI